MTRSKLTIRNFQRHRRLVIRLDPHVTTIVGPSDVGKSSIIRAIRWACLNKPRGQVFRRVDTDRTSVTLEVDGHKVVRAKGDHRNTYHLDGKKFAAFGGDVPTPIAEVLKLTDLNFQSQHDSPFWVSLSPGEVSKRLNEIVDLGLIDRTLGNLSSATRRARAEHQVIRDRLRSASEERRELSKRAGALDALALIEELEADRLAVAQRGSSLGSKLDALRGHLERTSRLLQAAVGARFLSQLADSWIHLADKVRNLSTLTQQALDLQAVNASRQVEILDLQNKLTEEMGSSCPLCGQSLPQ